MKLSHSNSLIVLCCVLFGSAPNAEASNLRRGLGDLATQVYKITLSSANLTTNTTPPFIQEPVGAGGDAKVKLQGTGSGKYQVCLDVTVDGFTPAIVHLHQGTSDEIGPVVAGFKSVLDGNVVDGCVSITEETFLAVTSNPSGYYINMHAGPKPEPDDLNADYYRGARANLA